MYVSLHTADPGVDGQSAGEVSGNAYARQSIAFSAPTAANPSVTSNSATVTFPTATPGNWGTITHFGLWNHVSNTAAANFIGASSLSASQVINAGNTASFAAGALVHNFSSV